MMQKSNIIVSVGIVILLIFLAGCTSSASPATNVVQPTGVVQVVGPVPTPTPVPHTIIGTWKVDYNGHKGTINFEPSGYMNIDVSGYPGASIAYTDEGNNNYGASYFVYSAQFKYNPENDTITSDQYPGVKLMRSV